MDYFDYSYKHNYIEFSSNIYRVGTYHYNWHGETEIFILLKGRVEMSCNDEVFTLEPLDAVIISPQVEYSMLALEEDVIAFTIHVGNEFYQQYDPNFGSYQFVVRSNESTRHNQFFKRQMGISFVDYVLRLRLRDATVRLMSSDEAIARIASSCDFADIKAFNVAFKKHFRMTPTEYRKQVKSIGCKTTLQDGVEIVSVENQDVLDLLHSFLSYEDDSRAKSELEFMSQKLETLKAKLADVVKEL